MGKRKMDSNLHRIKLDKGTVYLYLALVLIHRS